MMQYTSALALVSFDPLEYGSKVFSDQTFFPSSEPKFYTHSKQTYNPHLMYLGLNEF